LYSSTTEDRTLDWKRMLGIALWYGIGQEESSAKAHQLFDKLAAQDESCFPRPIVHYGAHDHQDLLYHLMKLTVDETYLLEQALVTDTYTPAKFNVRLAWQLQVLLRLLKVRDFADRDAMEHSSRQEMLYQTRSGKCSTVLWAPTWRT
jgi:hypothetical protein